MRSPRVRLRFVDMSVGAAISRPLMFRGSWRGISGTVALFALPHHGGDPMKLVLALLSALVLLSCASTPPPTREQALVDRAAQALGGSTGLQTIAVKGTTKQWEPEQSETPGGDMRFANEATWELSQDVARRITRTDIERRFAYPSPRTFKFTEIVTPDAGFVLGIDSNGRNAQNQQINPPAHAMSGLRLA